MDHHSFTKLKKGADVTPVKTVEIFGRTFKCRWNGEVLGFDAKTRMFDNLVSYWSPVAAEVRKASGWFE